MIKCSRCHRPLKSPAITSGNLTIGPVCAKRMGLQLAHKIRTDRAPVVLDGQKPLFEELS